MLVHQYLSRAARQTPDKDFIIQAKKRVSYGKIFQQSLAMAAWLHSNHFKPGFRAAILTDDPQEYVTAYFAIMQANGIVVGLNSQTSKRSLQKVLNDCTASVVFTSAKFTKYLDAVAASLPGLKTVAVQGLNKVSPKADNITWQDRDQLIATFTNSKDEGTTTCQTSDVAQIIYTSGTTGSPKGVMLTHANLVANTESIVQYLDLTQDDRAMAVLPFFYSYGNSVLLTHMAVGGSLVVNQNFMYPNVILDEMVKEEVTGFSGVPSTYAILLNRSAIKNYSFPNLRYLTQAGAAMAPKIADRLQELLPKVEIYIMYGQTEASARLSYLAPKDLRRKIGSIGTAIPGVTLKLLDSMGLQVKQGEIGEIVAQGGNIMTGYWNMPEETAKVLRPEGLWTGDYATMDEDGFFFIVSRKSDMIKSGAHRIAPKEIEEVIYEHEAVHEVAVVGVEDEILGEAIKACLVLNTEASCTAKEITKHCRRNLPAYKVPHQIEFLEELPKTTTGKIIKKDLR